MREIILITLSGGGVLVMLIGVLSIISSLWNKWHSRSRSSDYNSFSERDRILREQEQQLIQEWRQELEEDRLNQIRDAN